MIASKPEADKSRIRKYIRQRPYHVPENSFPQSPDAPHLARTHQAALNFEPNFEQARERSQVLAARQTSEFGWNSFNLCEKRQGYDKVPDYGGCDWRADRSDKACDLWD